MAAADYAEGKPVRPPPELLDYLRSKQFGSLPYAGGWKEQPFKFVERSIVYWNVYEAVVEYRLAIKNLKGKKLSEWIRNNKPFYDKVKLIGKMRNDSNG